MAKSKLRSEMRTEQVEQEILSAAREKFRHYNIEDNLISTVWEHGHWWVTFYDENEERQRQFDVVDVDIGGGNEFDFEEV